jgi:hypothetical protein
MCRHLRLQFIVEATTMKKVVNAAQEFSHKGSLFTRYAIRRMAWMALVCRSNWDASASSCFTPSLVSL